MTLGLIYYWDGEREQCEDNKWHEKTKKSKLQNTRYTWTHG